jgi:hypothetical protein
MVTSATMNRSLYALTAITSTSRREELLSSINDAQGIVVSEEECRETDTAFVEGYVFGSLSAARLEC